MPSTYYKTWLFWSLACASQPSPLYSIRISMGLRPSHWCEQSEIRKASFSWLRSRPHVSSSNEESSALNNYETTPAWGQPTRYQCTSRLCQRLETLITSPINNSLAMRAPSESLNLSYFWWAADSCPNISRQIWFLLNSPFCPHVEDLIPCWMSSDHSLQGRSRLQAWASHWPYQVANWYF